VSTWVRGLCGAPDVPQGKQQQQQHSSSLAEELSNDGDTVIATYTPAELLKLCNGNNADVGLRLIFVWSTSPHNNRREKWDAVVWQNNLYLQVPNGSLVGTSKEAFVALLDYAEEMRCANVLICLPKLRPEKNQWMRMFSFFGFDTLPPNHPLVPMATSDDLVFMAYHIE